MSQTSRISKNNTVCLDNRDGSKTCILHKTPIVQWWPEDRKVRLDTGGWFTATTRTRMAQVFSEWGIPVRVGFTKAGNVAEVYDRATGETVSSHEFSRDSLCYLTY